MKQAKLTRGAAVFALSVLTFGCTSEGQGFTLYRASPSDAQLRIHVATFDAEDGSKYNQENCKVAATLFQGQPGTTVSYWCEKGTYKK
jgi:hypothetical protein